MGFIPESVRVMGARASESGMNTWEKTKDKYVEISQIVRADLKGWLVCLAVLVITVVRSGITYSFGMFVVELQKEFPDMTMAEQSKYTCTLRQQRTYREYDITKLLAKESFRNIQLFHAAINTIMKTVLLQSNFHYSYIHLYSSQAIIS